ncbi:MAG: hypothetical protein WAQ33_01395 [Gaiellaceae bacterium]
MTIRRVGFSFCGPEIDAAAAGFARRGSLPLSERKRREVVMARAQREPDFAP